MLRFSRLLKLLKNSRKAQTSMEYLTIVGIAMLLLVPASILFLNYTKTTNAQVISSQFNLIGTTIINKAEEMYVIGQGSWITIDVSMPENLVSAEIRDNRDLIFTYETAGGQTQAIFFVNRFEISNNKDDCKNNCNININTGLNSLRVQYNGTHINIYKPN